MTSQSCDERGVRFVRRLADHLSVKYVGVDIQLGFRALLFGPWCAPLDLSSQAKRNNIKLYVRHLSLWITVTSSFLSGLRGSFL